VNAWDGGDVPVPVGIGAAGWAVAILRGTVLAGVTYGCLLVLLLVRLIERPLFGAGRPVTPFITQFVCRTAFAILGIGYAVRGVPMQGGGAVVANHASWLDIFTLNACQRVTFVSKAEVAGWPGIGWLARATGTVFIARDRREAKDHADVLTDRLRAGQRLLFFPEGTSTDGLRVLPFKSTLFASLFDAALDNGMRVQPVSVIYHAPRGTDRRHYGWWGDMGFAPHLVQTLAAWRQGSVEVVFHDTVLVSDFASRKALAQYCEQRVRAGVEAGLQAPR
jgi:lyso-ornithine lipid O-acyltransferase